MTLDDILSGKVKVRFEGTLTLVDPPPPPPPPAEFPKRVDVPLDWREPVIPPEIYNLLHPQDAPWRQNVSSWKLHPDNALLMDPATPKGLGACKFRAGNLPASRPGYPACGVPFMLLDRYGECNSYSVKCRYVGNGSASTIWLPPTYYQEGNNLAGKDHHIVAILTDISGVWLQEIYDLTGWENGVAQAASAVIWDLTRPRWWERPMGSLSSDAAGLPILPLCALYQEIAAGVIPHALRCCPPTTRPEAIPPATSFTTTGATGPKFPPMGLRIRLNKSRMDARIKQTGWDMASPWWSVAKPIWNALETYGAIVADNGGMGGWTWLSGTCDNRLPGDYMQYVTYADLFYAEAIIP